jgi:hypothetical protein
MKVMGRAALYVWAASETATMQEEPMPQVPLPMAPVCTANEVVKVPPAELVTCAR